MIFVYYVAEPEVAGTLVEDGPRGAAVPGVEVGHGEPAVIGGLLWGVVAGAPLEFDPMRFDTWVDDDVTMVHEACGQARIREGFVRALAALPDGRIPAVAEVWATADEWERWDEPWAPGEADALVLGLRDLARTALGEGLPMYVWFEG